MDKSDGLYFDYQRITTLLPLITCLYKGSHTQNRSVECCRPCLDFRGQEIFLFSLLSSRFPSGTPNYQAIKDITECGHDKIEFPYPGRYFYPIWFSYLNPVKTGTRCTNSTKNIQIVHRSKPTVDPPKWRWIIFCRFNLYGFLNRPCHGFRRHLDE